MKYEMYQEQSTLYGKAKSALKNKGPFTLIKYFFEYFYQNIKPRKKVNLKNKSFNVYRSWRSNLSVWRGEREAELPIAHELIKLNAGKSILEVGNVLRNYYSFDFPFEVLDKYERGEGIINKDAEKYSTKKRYDLIISISTLEHIGKDEVPRKLQRSINSIENLRSLLKPKGRLFFTFAWGSNHYLEEKIINGDLKFKKVIVLRKNKNNNWDEVDIKEVIQDTQLKPHHAVFMGEMVK